LYLLFKLISIHLNGMITLCDDIPSSLSAAATAAPAKAKAATATAAAAAATITRGI
jgi:hypothetical protein